MVACYLGTAYSLYLLDHNVEFRPGCAAPQGPGQFSRRLL